MRDSNHSFPSLNRACVSISSSLYDRRAIDSPVPTLPLLTSLQHLAYLTSTSPRIREILTVDGGLERLISIVETCIDLAYPERARSAPSSSSSSSTAIPSTSASTSAPFRTGGYASTSSSATSRPSSSDRKGKQPEDRNYVNETLANNVEDDLKPLIKKLVPFKAFSAYANYPFSIDSDSEEEDEELAEKEDDTVMDITLHDHEQLPAFTIPSKKKTAPAHSASRKTAMTLHEREVKLLKLERTFIRNFILDYKDLPALVHTYGFALQCLVNVGVRGSESIRTRVVEAGVLGVVARILGGFLDYRATEREKRQKIIASAQAEKEREKESHSSSIAHLGGASNSRRERQTSMNTSGESDVTAVISSSSAARRERRDRDAALMAAQAQTLALAQAQISAHQREYSLAHSQSQAAQQHQQQPVQQSQHYNMGNSATPLVAGMAAPPNATAASPFTNPLTAPRQTRSAAVQALLNSSTEMPTRALRQYNSSVIPPLHTSPTVRVSPRRAGSASSIASSSSQYQQQQALSNPVSSSSSSGTTIAAISSLVAGSILINRTNTPDTIASLDEVQEFSDVNADEIESTTSSGHEEGNVSNSNNNTIVDILMEDGVGSSENELQSTSDLVISSTMVSNPASRSVSRNRINANVLAQHRPVPPPSSSSSLAYSTNDASLNNESSVAHHQHGEMESSGTQVHAPPMLGDVTIKLVQGDAGIEVEDGTSTIVGTEDDDDEGDVVMERENEEENTTDGTGTSASPVSRPPSSHLMHHQLVSPSSRRTASSQYLHQFTMPTPTSGTVTHGVNAHTMARSDSTSSLNAMAMDNETTPISRPIPLRRQSSAVVTATPRNAFSSTTVVQNTLSPISQTQSHSVPISYNYLSHAAPYSTLSSSRARSQGTTETTSVTSQELPPQSPSTSSSTSKTSRQPHTSTHVHLRLHPQLQQTAAAQPSIMRDGHAHLLLNYGPLMDHYVKEEDVLHCLHLLAYLSKYPHVRAVFHDPENEICRPPTSPSSVSVPAGVESASTAAGNTDGNRGNCCSCARKKLKVEDQQSASNAGDDGAATSSSASAASLSAAEDGGHQSSASSSTFHHHHHGHACSDNESSSKMHSRSTSSGSQKHSHPCCSADDERQHGVLNEEDREEAESLARARAMATMPAKDRKPALEPSRPPRSTANNVFSLVEQYTFRPSSPADRSMRLGSDIQYWAGVIMRNACRKDELRGGIRQCANMGCGVWERFPREFAKCRRCRKAKYCSKGCQRRAWQAGHRYWCSARQDAPPAQPPADGSADPAASNSNNVAVTRREGGAGANAGSDNDEEIEGVLPSAPPPPGGVNPNNTAGGNNPAAGGVIDGITVGGEDGNHDNDGGFDTRIRMGGGNGEIGMLEGM